MPDKIKTDPFSTIFQPVTPKVPKEESKEKPEVMTNVSESQFLLQTLSLSQSMISWLDDKAHEVKSTGFRKANRSSIARFAISKIQENGINHEEFMEFVKREQGL